MEQIMCEVRQYLMITKKNVAVMYSDVIADVQWLGSFDGIDDGRYSVLDVIDLCQITPPVLVRQ